MIVYETARRDTWILDIAQSTASRLSTEGEANAFVWSPDGRFVSFTAFAGGMVTIGRVAADGSGSAELLATGRGRRYLSSWSPDGTTLEYVEASDMEGQNDIRTPALTTSGFPLTSVIRTPFSEDHPEFSPDGRWLACQSNETGRMEVYLQRYGGPRQRVRVSRTGGTDPAWNPKGRELFYLSPDEAGTSWMTVVTIQTEPALVVGTPRRLLAAKAVPMSGDPFRLYQVTRDGQRFLVRRVEQSAPAAPVTHVNLVQNWFEELKAKVPARR